MVAGDYADEETSALAVEPTHVGPQPGLRRPEDSAFRPDPNDPYIGLLISERYRVLRKLGEGGMGIVYLAEHIVIEKKVALKILSDDFARKPDLVQRFMQEAKAASRIGHENIVDITDFGQTAAGSVFIAMEFLEGSDLATAIRANGPMTFARVLPIVTMICRALAAAHGKGIIHRDLKPENIFLVTRDGRPDFVKVLDFGIAKMSNVDEASERLTRTGMIFGTPEYMSPEQARGERPDHRVDIYALGCIVYEMLTGDVPFHAETFMGVLTKHLFETPELVSAHAEVPPAVEAVVMKALAKNRDERFQSMRDFGHALAACASPEEVQQWGIEASGIIFSQSLPASASDPSLPRPARTALSARSMATGETVAHDLRPARGPLAVVVGSVLLAVAGVAGFALWPRKPVTTPTITSIETSPPVKPLVPPPVIPPVEAPSTVVINVQVVPAGTHAIAYLGSEVLGSVPGPLALPLGKSKVTISVRRPGAREGATLALVPDHEATHEVSLPVLAVHRPPVQGPRSLPKPPVHVEPVQAPAKPDEPVVTKPKPKPQTTQDGDLMNPFVRP